MRSAREGVDALSAELRAQGGAAAGALLDRVAGFDEGASPGPAQIAASGPRARGNEAEYELLIEMIHEGTLLHYGGPRVLRDSDPDLALLLGDQLYAMGLSRLAVLGDLDAVAELADLISLLGQARAEGPAEEPAEAVDELVAAIWCAGATAIGWGSNDAHESAKALARAGDERAVAALHQGSRRRGS